MKVLFVYPNLTRQITLQIGIASLSSVLKREGHICELFDITFIDRGNELQAFEEKIKIFRPDLIAISCRSLEWPFVKKMLSLVSKDIPTVLGGCHPTVSPLEVIENKEVDFVVIGEGELVLTELVDRLERNKDPTSIKNVWLKANGHIIKNEIRPYIEDLDTLPIPDWDLFNSRHFLESYLSKEKGYTVVGVFEMSRGCPYSCTYCINNYLQDIYRHKGRYHREKSIKRVLQEMKVFKNKYGLDYVFFVDETFLAKKKSTLEELKEAYIKEINVPFGYMSHPDQVTEERLNIVKQMNAHSAAIGIESGDEEFRKKILGRNMRQEVIIKAFNLTKKYNIKTHSFNMIGLPHEDREIIEKTIQLNRMVKPDSLQISIFYPFKGTKLYDICNNESLLRGEEENLTNYYQHSILNFPKEKKRALFKLSKLMPMYVRINKFLLFIPRILEKYDFLFNIWWKAYTWITTIKTKMLYFRYIMKRYGIAGITRKIITKLKRSIPLVV